jgi:hypothetical protein
LSQQGAFCIYDLLRYGALVAVAFTRQKRGESNVKKIDVRHGHRLHQS